MAASLADQIMEAVGPAAQLYYRLVIVAAPAGAGKSAALHTVQARSTAAFINVNLELARRLLELTARQRALQTPRVLAELVQAAATELVLLDNLEVLFDVTLQQDPLRLLQRLARNTTLVVAWGGVCHDNMLTYAAPEHVEYRRYPVQDFLVVQPEAAS